ncbi:MAG TPA: hypothetical protein VF876_17720 [Burkholderiales bacterium]
MRTLKLAGAVVALALSAQALAVGGLADVNVYDRTEKRQLRVYWHEGHAYVAGKPGNEYQVTVRSRQGDDLLAVMSVDGINVVTGETAHPRQSGYVLGPWGGLEVKGWRKNLSRTAAFYFTALPDSYAARTGRPEDVGVIGVALFRRKVEPPQPLSRIAPAPAESSARAEAPVARSQSGGGAAADAVRRAEPLGTGHGRSEASHAHWVEFERATAQPVETIVIRYDSHANLVALGVIRERGRPPRPFPGFVPDPVGAAPGVTPSSGA